MSRCRRHRADHRAGSDARLRPLSTRPTAFEIGSAIRERALAENLPIIVDIRTWDRPLFYAALPGSNASNPDWARRKINVVQAFLRSTYRLVLEQAAARPHLQGRRGARHRRLCAGRRRLSDHGQGRRRHRRHRRVGPAGARGPRRRRRGAVRASRAERPRPGAAACCRKIDDRTITPARGIRA